MSIMESLREAAAMPAGPMTELANELLVIRASFEEGEMSREDYEYLVNEIKDIKAQQNLADDEVACRWVVSACEVLVGML